MHSKLSPQLMKRDLGSAVDKVTGWSKLYRESMDNADSVGECEEDMVGENTSDSEHRKC